MDEEGVIRAEWDHESMSGNFTKKKSNKTSKLATIRDFGSIQFISLSYDYMYQLTAAAKSVQC